ncbi:MurR/RpiR family transcriptional regulator [Clostridium tarantellae]|uniref:SIS domain-containing protein n=1 Tax=Clostridium tarantellae TaxID=39493 RepID=A0A6I1MMC3_9CLOT|nr:MurR/RpiR family transcriptional regulator [Clostridium tarantellae]MPQ43267.1 SIS domain-containing protein [Clostridium tarantellae]
MNILCNIQKKYNIFSIKEKNLADYILHNCEDINNMNIKDLAKISGTSGATITRFCKKIDCESFVDMKMKLNAIKPEIKVNKKENGILTDVYNYYKEVIERTKHLINSDNIYRFVNAIKNANKIYIYGVGSSGLTATEMMQRLLRMGLNVHSISDSHMMIINSAIVSPNDLVIGISISGETEEILQSLKICKDKGANILSITSFENSSITKYSHMNFIVYNTVFVDKENFINSQFSTMYLLDLISMVLLKDEELSGKMKLTVDAIINN